jgi:hypothetical protein
MMPGGACGREAPVTIDEGGLMPKAKPRDGRQYRLLTAGAAMVGAAAVIGLTGLALGGTAVVAEIRRHLERLEVPPRQLARRQLHQARSALASGARAWRTTTVTRRDPASAPDMSVVPTRISA